MKIIYFLCVFGFSVFANSAGVYDGIVESVQSGPVYSGKVFVKINGDASNIPGCVENKTWTLIFDGTSEEGKITTSIFMTAYASGNLVSAVGKGTCNLWDGVEDLSHVRFQLK